MCIVMKGRQSSCRVHVGLLGIVPTIRVKLDCHVEMDNFEGLVFSDYYESTVTSVIEHLRMCMGERKL